MNKLLKNLFLTGLTLVACGHASAQSTGGKSFLQQLEEQAAFEIKENKHQGAVRRAEDSVQKAREFANSNSRSCPKGSVIRKYEDVKEYIQRHEELQQRLAMSMENYTSLKISKSDAIAELNMLIGKSNEIVIWGRGRVTDGACGSIKQTEIIGKTANSTSILIDNYKQLFN